MTDKQMLESLIAEAEGRLYGAWYDSGRAGWIEAVRWLQSHLDALPKEPSAHFDTTVDYALDRLRREEQAKIATAEPAPAIPPDLAEALHGWREHVRRYSTSVVVGIWQEHERILAAAYDAAVAKGEL
jgi:hypothetical protein